ncbi:TIGR03085 family protein [Nakamurella sp. YIM 132087]|uniref:TIGR03085 family protein n=1 Tax=Nakamurella alba TaxID=2665158 RepID=A0A7K1FI30_9ACTN|nr:TIGR03085 family metal-binding protein [Nakamurella alba]MTD13740.1 TIGR03085 family protein [Nakamurella alba]
MSLANSERAALADLFDEVGPDPDTLCEGWRSADLLTHLLVRERRPDAAAGMLVPALRGHAAKVEQAVGSRPWAEKVAQFRSGPPGWNPMGWGPLDELTNGAEMLIHHEDLRRGTPGFGPRTLPPGTWAQARKILDNPLIGRPLRKAGVGVLVRITDAPPGEPGSAALRAGGPVAELTGSLVDLILWLAGRRTADVDLAGDPDAVAALDRVQRVM